MIKSFKLLLIFLIPAVLFFLIYGVFKASGGRTLPFGQGDLSSHIQEASKTEGARTKIQERVTEMLAELEGKKWKTYPEKIGFHHELGILSLYLEQFRMAQRFLTLAKEDYFRFMRKKKLTRKQVAVYSGDMLLDLAASQMYLGDELSCSPENIRDGAPIQMCLESSQRGREYYDQALVNLKQLMALDKDNLSAQWLFNLIMYKMYPSYK